MSKAAHFTLEPGDIVIRDNLGSHKSLARRGRIQAAGARLRYLAALFARLNPIAQAFTKIKHWMRTAQKRTVQDTWRHIESLLATLEPSECHNSFANAGYASVKTGNALRPMAWKQRGHAQYMGLNPIADSLNKKVAG